MEKSRVPTETDRYRITWQDLVHYARLIIEERPLRQARMAMMTTPEILEWLCGTESRDEEIHKLHAF